MLLAAPKVYVLKLQYISSRGREELMGKYIKCHTKVSDHFTLLLNLPTHV